MNWQKHFLGLVAALVMTTAPATAATVVAYNSSNGATLSASAVGDGIVAQDVTRGAALAQAGGNTFNSRNWSQAGTMAEAIAAGSYLTWGFTSDVPLLFDTLGIGFNRSPQGPASIALEMAVNGGAWTTLFDFAAPDFSANTTWVASGTFQGVSGVTEAMFRLVGWDAGNWAGAFRLAEASSLDGRAFVLTASPIVAIPLPSALPLMGGALLLLGLVGLRRRKAA